MLHGAILRSPLAHADILSIDVSAALQHPKVHAVLTAAELGEMAWMPTLSDDVQSVLASDTVRFQGQEIAFVIAEDHYSARDALGLIDVEYEPLPVVVDARRALDDDATPVRESGNRVFDWEAGDAAATERVFGSADVVVEQDMVFPRSHRALYSLITGLPEHKLRVISPDVGGGFGNKVPVYPGYVCALAGAMALGRPVKWVEDRSENLMSTGFARDYSMRGRIAATRDGKIQALDVDVIADHGAFNAAAQPSRYPAGFFSVFTGSYDVEAAHCRVTGAFTNKAPGGVAYSCSFRIAEAVYLVERLVDCLARELDRDPVELRRQNLIRPEQFPYASKTGWVYDSGDYEAALDKALALAGYHALRAEQRAKRANGELMGIGVSFFTEAVGAGPRK